MTSFREIYKSIKHDPALISKIDFSNLSIQQNDYLEGKTTNAICNEIFNSLSGITSVETRMRFCKKLAGYRHIEHLCDLRTGRFCRWIHQGNDQVLQTGGIAVNIKIEDDVQIVCKIYGRRGYVTCRLNECIVFQKLTEEENLILLANEYLHHI